MKKLALLTLLGIITSITQAQWTKMGPYISSISCFLVKDQSLFISTTYLNDNKFYMFDTSGQKWIEQSTGTAIFSMTHIGNSIYGVSNLGVYSSGDNGVNWELCGTPPLYGNCIIASNDTLWVGTGGSYGDVMLYYSADNGATWVKSGSPIPSISAIEVLIKKGNTLFAGTGSGVYMSNNKGETWTRWNITNQGYVQSIISTNTTTLIAGTENGLYISNNNGSNWVRNTTNEMYRRNVRDLTQHESTLYAATDSGVYVSENNGTTWTQHINGLPQHKLIWHIAVKDSTIYLANAMTGLFTSTIHDLHWKSSNKGIQMTIDVTAITATNNTLYAGIRNYGVYLSEDNGTSWEEYIDGIGPYGAVKNFVIDSSNNKVYVASGTWVSVDSAHTGWKGLNSGYPGGWITRVEKCGDYLFALVDGNIYKYLNNTWQKIDTSALENSSLITTMGQRLYVSSYSGLYFSDDYGTNWNRLDEFNWNEINTMTSNGSVLYVARGGKGVSVSLDSGSTWMFRNTGIPDSTIFNYTSFVTYGNIVLLTTIHDIYMSTDTGLNWVRINTDDLSPSIIQSVSMNAHTLFVATQNGLWNCAMQALDTTVHTGINNISNTTNHRLYVYPNPFSDYTIVKTPADMKYATLMIDNLYGQTIKTQHISAGETAVVYRDNLPSGLYIMKLITDQGTISSQKVFIAD